jgi:hypothetical protein
MGYQSKTWFQSKRQSDCQLTGKSIAKNQVADDTKVAENLQVPWLHSSKRPSVMAGKALYFDSG